MLLRAIEFLGLSIWLGSDVFLSFVVAPGAFAVLASRDDAGAIVGYSLTRMHLLGIACGMVILILRALRTRSVGSLAAPAALFVIGMMVLSMISQVAVTPRMAALRTQMGSIQATAVENPLLAAFLKLHQVSVLLESGVLLCGFAALYLMVRELALKR
ncbi:MAG TPA: DUF4149 domain-containing protein [Terriglobales bacterium]|nr:DUF4149 domain-containing protein [Terriglobales bacterium]